MNIYIKKNISNNAKLKHYQTVICPEALYAAETLNLARTKVIKRLEQVERKLLGRKLGPLRAEDRQFRKSTHTAHNKRIRKLFCLNNHGCCLSSFSVRTKDKPKRSSNINLFNNRFLKDVTTMTHINVDRCNAIL